MGEQIALLTAAPHNLTREQAIAALTVIVAAQNDRPNINSIVEGRLIQLPTAAELTAMPGLAATLDTLDNTITPGGTLRDAVGRAAGITGLAGIKASLATAPAPVAPATPDAAKSADVMTNGVEYAIAIREYTAMANRLPEGQRAGALALIDGTRNAEALTSLNPLPAGVTPAIRDVAVRVANERGAYVAALDASTAPAEIDAAQAAQIADRTRTAAIASVGSGTSVGTLTPENLRRGIAGDINAIMPTSPGGVTSTIGTAINTAAATAPNEPIRRAIGTTNGNLATVAAAAEAERVRIAAASDEYRVGLNIQGGEISFLQLAQAGLGTNHQGVAVPAGTRTELERLNTQVRAALVAGGIPSPTNEQIANASALILALENGERDGNHDMRIRRDLVIPSNEEITRATGVYVQAIAATSDRGTRITGDEKDAIEARLGTTGNRPYTREAGR
jgi:hypothetical protein